MSRKESVRKAIEAISAGDARALRKHIKEALLSKVRVAVDKREQKIARSLIESTNKISTPLNESATVVVAFNVEKNGSVVAKAGTKVQVSSKDDLAKLVKISSAKNLFADSDHEKRFDSILAKGGTAYVYVDPYHEDVNNTVSLGVASSQKEAQDQYNDSAGDI